MASEEIKKALIQSGLRFSATGEPQEPEEESGIFCFFGCYYTGCNLGACMSSCAMGCDQNGACWVGCFSYDEKSSTSS